MILITNTYINVLSRVIRNAFFSQAAKVPEFYPQVFNVIDEGKGNPRPFIDNMTLSGFGTMSEKPQGQILAYDDAFEGFVTRYVYLTYALGYRVSKEMMAEDALGIIPRLPQALAYSARQTVELRVWDILNLGFTAGIVGGDGQTLFSSAHPLKGGGSFSNTLGTTVLSPTSLQSAIINGFDTLVDERNLPIVRTAKFLTVPPALEKTGLEIIKSQYVPFTGNNEVNIQYERLGVVVSRYLTSNTAWFILGQKGEPGEGDHHHLNVFWKWKDNFESDKDFDTKSLKNSLDFRFTYGWDDWRGTLGSQGA
jgi:hypothetical protein